MYGETALRRAGRALEAAHHAQSDLNIFTHLEDEEALRHAAEIDKTVAGGGTPGPLTGVPIAVKDLIDHAGRVTTCGSAFYRRQANATAPALAAMEEAGAVVIGRTGLHEWAFGFSSENEHFGPVRNPWDPATSTGGSSGGSGAAVGAGIVPIALGTDTGGSVRVPAALCGCLGLKVTYGRVPLEGVFPLVPSLDTVGPLASDVAGLTAAYRAMSGDADPVPEPGRLRIGIPQPWYEEAPLQDQVGQGFERAVTALRGLGHEVNPILLPDVLPGPEITAAIASEVVAVHHVFRKEGRKYGSEVAARLDAAALVTPEQQRKARDWQQMIRARFEDALATVDLLATPTVPAMKKWIGVDQIDGVHYRTVLSWFTAIVNHAGNPAVALPLAGTGTPPVSLQLIGPRLGEKLLLSMSRQLEAAGVVGFVPAHSE